MPELTLEILRNGQPMVKRRESDFTVVGVGARDELIWYYREGPFLMGTWCTHEGEPEIGETIQVRIGRRRIDARVLALPLYKPAVIAGEGPDGDMALIIRIPMPAPGHFQRRKPAGRTRTYVSVRIDTRMEREDHAREHETVARPFEIGRPGCALARS